jgi:cellulose synthase/poly-beta-1,6-N-acetylglucosamine synthase-like glycosyltransferase
MVGGDGAIYGIRRPLWRALPENAINDFLNPLQIVTAGHRGIYEPEAICYEETAGRVGREWRRRVRIVSRSWRAVFQSSGALNPFKVGLFAFCLFSHKVLRWFSGLFVAGVLLAALSFAYGAAQGWDPSTAALVAGGACLFLAVPKIRRLAAFVIYFVTISMASVVGVVRGTFGSVSGVWAPPRAQPGSIMLRPGVAVLVAAAVGLPAAAMALAISGRTAAPWVFWTALAIVSYVYVGYGLILRAVAAVRDKPVTATPITPRICLLIAAHNEAGVIAQKIENSLQLDYPPALLDVVVASDGSTDATNELTRAFSDRGVQLLPFPARRGKIASINDAMKAISAEIVIFSDANTFLRPDAVRMLVRNFADPEVGAVSGDVVLIGERAALAGSEDLYYRYERALQRVESRLGSLIGVDGALYALRRQLFVPPPPDTILDDMAIPMAVIRAGYRVVFEEDALADEEGSASASEEFSRKSRVIAGAVQFLLRRDSALPIMPLQPLVTLVSHKALRWMSPAFAALLFAASLLMATESSLFAGMVTVELAVLGAGLLGCVPRLRRIGAIGLSHYLCLVQCAAAVGFFRGLTGRQPVAWRRFARAGAHGL